MPLAKPSDTTRLGLLRCFTGRYAYQCPLTGLNLIHPLRQAKATNEELAKLGDLLEIPSSNLTAEIGDNWFPRRGLGPVPPQDPLLYRLFEVNCLACGGNITHTDGLDV